jgi:polyhydroxyalkanoate synthase subunit PhaC
MTDRPDLPGPNLRRGPRPLLLHLTLAAMRSAVSKGTSLNWSNGWPMSNVASAAILRSIQQAAAIETIDVQTAVAAEAIRQDTDLIAGIAAYRRHPWRRDLPDVQSIWREGGSSLFDFAPDNDGPVILFVPSLINRAYILDLQSGGSMMRWFAAQGARPLLLDWGTPGDLEREFTLTDYVAGRLERALTATVQLTGKPPFLAGYCMGGTLAVAAAQRREDLIEGLILLAAPWDFHAPDDSRAALATQVLDALEPIMRLSAVLPVDCLQSLFALLDPWSVADKYRRFGRMNQDSDAVRRFVAMEDWLNDGVPLAAPVARACLADWYGRNLPAKGQWRIAGMAIDPAAIQRPSFVAIPGQDRIVPPESATALATRLRFPAIHRPGAGHIGMAAGPRAEKELWKPLWEWLKHQGTKTLH